MEITIEGYSDDAILVKGPSFTEQFDVNPDDGPIFLGVGDGTLFEVTYTEDALWRLIPLAIGAGSTYSKTEATVITNKRDNIYSDVVTLNAPNPAWVLVGNKKRLL